MPTSRRPPEVDTWRGWPEPWWSAPTVALYLGDVRACLRVMPARSVHCVVTSPPYWNLRDYQVAGQIGAEPSPDCDTHGQAQCGACFVCSMVDVFHELHRVLRDDGTCWLNLGDTFNSGQAEMIPARVNIALRKDGWFAVQPIVWYSPNKLPEPVTNRCTKSHENIFLLAKSSGYYYDSVAIEDDTVEPNRKRSDRIGGANGHTVRHSPGGIVKDNTTTKNKRDVWIVPTQGYPGAHFATFSPQLITPCILAGTSEYGCCVMCGRPWKRVVVRTGGQSANGHDGSRDRSFNWSRNGKPGSKSTLDGTPATRETVGWQKMCRCQTDEVVPCTILDPFVGSGTTVATSIELGRRAVGIDLSESYLRDHAVPRIETSIHGNRIHRPPVVTIKAGSPLPPRRVRE